MRRRLEEQGKNAFVLRNTQKLTKKRTHQETEKTSCHARKAQLGPLAPKRLVLSRTLEVFFSVVSKLGPARCEVGNDYSERLGEHFISLIAQRK